MHQITSTTIILDNYNLGREGSILYAIDSRGFSLEKKKKKKIAFFHRANIELVINIDAGI